MKRRLSLWMAAVFVPLFILLSWWLTERSFALSMQREQEQAQLTESIIACEIRSALSARPYEAMVQAARQYRAAYAAQGIELLLCYNGSPIGGSVLPTRLYDGLLGGGRCAMLDTLSSPERYAVADPLTHQLTLIVLRDVSGLYTLRTEQRRLFALCAVLGTLLILPASRLIAGGFARPVARLSEAALALARQETLPHALPLRRRDEVGELARSFAAMQHAVQVREEALRQETDDRQRMLDALAHELRTPLCALLGSARLMQEPLAPEERSAIVEDMVREIKRLSEMDSHLMKLTSLRTEPPEQEPVSLLSLLRETAVRLAGQGNPLLVEGRDTVLIGDRALLSLMVDNLAINALRASSAGQTVTLTALTDGFSVQDEGIGMTEEQLSHVLEPFYKADQARTRKLGGVGLGLTLCARIAALHGGRLFFASQPGRGTRVTFTASLQSPADSVTPDAVSCVQEVSHP